MQIPARKPTATAMAAASLDVLSDGRFRLGLGLSGPQVSEGWYGEPFTRPLRRTREYVDVVRRALAREPVAARGRGRRWAWASRSSCWPSRSRTQIPVYLGAIGPQGRGPDRRDRRRLAAVPLQPRRRRGAARPAGSRASRRPAATARTIDIAPVVPIAVEDDVETPARRCARGWPSTSGRWAPRTRTSTSSSPTATATATRPARVQDAFLSRRPRRRRGGGHRRAARRRVDRLHPGAAARARWPTTSGPGPRRSSRSPRATTRERLVRLLAEAGRGR